MQIHVCEHIDAHTLSHTRGHGHGHVRIDVVCMSNLRVSSFDTALTTAASTLLRWQLPMLRTLLAGVLTRTWFLLFSLCTMSALVPVALVVVVTVTKTASVVVVVVLVVVRVVVPAAAAATAAVAVAVAHEETKHTLTETTRALQSHKLPAIWSQRLGNQCSISAAT